ncbi:MAG: type II toxin-antitoxin system VapC family toxin [Deltaproteobacteria bacterium]|nr:type II toxin-antitoxin system VapC family toxin [Deltaproteobacteria bacterium]
MKSFLLDTHVWVWSLVEPKRLSPKVRNTLEDEKAELFLSPITLWEAILLGERGKVEMKPDPVQWVRDRLLASPLREAPINCEIAIQSRALNLQLQDPADRFLVATAIVFNLTLITADQTLLKCRTISCLKAT